MIPNSNYINRFVIAMWSLSTFYSWSFDARVPCIAIMATHSHNPTPDKYIGNVPINHENYHPARIDLQCTKHLEYSSHSVLRLLPVYKFTTNLDQIRILIDPPIYYCTHFCAHRVYHYRWMVVHMGMMMVIMMIIVIII